MQEGLSAMLPPTVSMYAAVSERKGKLDEDKLSRFFDEIRSAAALKVNPCILSKSIWLILNIRVDMEKKKPYIIAMAHVS